jgi:ADP-ribose diphosphatase
MPEKPVILDSRIVAESRIFRIERLALRFSNGTRTEYERLVGSAYGAVLIVPVLDAETLLLIREYAAGTERYELGFPKGRVEQGEDLLAAADRELMEEVGYGARRLEHIDSLSLAPGYLSHTTHIILARDLYPKRLPGDEPEEIEVIPWALKDLRTLIARDDFSEGRSIAALFLAREILKPASET